MAKRRLNRRQKQAISRIQARRLERASERSRRLEEELDDTRLGPEITGRVIAHHGASLMIEDPDGHMLRCFSRQNIGPVVCGDQVVMQALLDETDSGVVSALVPRSTQLARPGHDGQLKAVAANIDRLVIVNAVEPKPTPRLIDSYLVAAEVCGIEAIVALNKSDLLTADNRTDFEQLLGDYGALGYTTCEISSHTSDGLKALKDLLVDNTSVLVGQSGVGKSSLINSLIPDQDAQVGRLNKGFGRHTTSVTTLYHLPDGGNLIDSPGVRQFGLWTMTADEITHGFRELRDLTGQCKFSDCRHQEEPGCAVQAALANGDISQRRFESWQGLLAGLQEEN